MEPDRQIRWPHYQSQWIGQFPSLTADGQPAMMNDTSVVQIYAAKWN